MVSLVKEKSIYTVSGQLKHRDGDPLPQQKVQLFSPGWLNDKLKAEALTDWEGYYTLVFTKKHPSGPLDLILKVFEETVGEKNKFTCIKKEPLSLDPSVLNHNVKAIQVALYERNSTLPMLDPPENGEENPERATFAYRVRLLHATLFQKVKEKIASNLSIDDVQKLFPELPHALTEESTIDLLLNGIDPCHFRLDKDGNLCHLILLQQYPHDPSPALPVVGVTLIKEGGEKKLRIQSIYASFTDDKDFELKPTDKDFAYALYLLNSMALLEGEIKHHLGIGHLMTGQLALSHFRTINLHPIGTLLNPHLSGVAIINQLGGAFIFGDEGVLNVSGLTPEGIDEALRSILAAQDFATFMPRKPLSEEHRFAKAQILYWEIVAQVVDQFFKENDAQVKENWHEIFNLSRSLVKNSLPFKPLNDDGAPPNFPWADASEIAGLKTPIDRQIYLDEQRAISPITLKKENPDNDDIERLKQFCRYALFLSTFYHFALHGSQTAATDLSFASLALEGNGKAPYGGTKPENGAKQLAIANTLLTFTSPALLDNSDGDIYQPLLDAIREKLPEFNALGYDLTKMLKGVII